MAAPIPATEIPAAQAAVTVGLNSEWSRKFADTAGLSKGWSRKFAAAAAAVAASTDFTAAPNPGSEYRRRELAVAAAIAAVSPDPGAEILADAEILTAQAAVLNSECRRKFGTQLVGRNSARSDNFTAAVATAAQTAFVDKIEGYYLELAKQLSELLEDAKQFFTVEKDAITKRLKKENDEIIVRLKKETDEITERLLKEKDEVTERLLKEKDEVTERLNKEKEEIIERINAEFHNPSKRRRFE